MEGVAAEAPVPALGLGVAELLRVLEGAGGPWKGRQEGQRERQAQRC